MSTFYCGVQHEIVPHIVFQDLACLWVGVFLYSSNIQHMHSHKYWRWTICFTLHRKAFELIKIFVRLSKKHEHNAKYGIEWAPSSHIYEAIQNGIMMHFSLCNIICICTYEQMNILDGCGLRKCIFIIAFEIRRAQVTTEN